MFPALTRKSSEDRGKKVQRWRHRNANTLVAKITQDLHYDEYLTIIPLSLTLYDIGQLKYLN